MTTYLTIADAITRLTGPRAPKWVRMEVTSLPDKAPCAFCEKPTLGSYSIGVGLLPADVECRWAFYQQVDPERTGDPFLTTRVVNVLESGEALA